MASGVPGEPEVCKESHGISAEFQKETSLKRASCPNISSSHASIVQQNWSSIKAGLNLMTDATGNLFKDKRAVTRMDVICNELVNAGLSFLCFSFTEVVAAAIRGTPPSRTRVSSHVFGQATLHFLWATNSLPSGVSINAPSVHKWALRNGLAIRKLARILVAKLNGNLVK